MSGSLVESRKLDFDLMTAAMTYEGPIAIFGQESPLGSLLCRNVFHVYCVMISDAETDEIQKIFVSVGELETIMNYFDHDPGDIPPNNWVEVDFSGAFKVPTSIRLTSQSHDRHEFCIFPFHLVARASLNKEEGCFGLAFEDGSMEGYYLTFDF